MHPVSIFGARDICETIYQVVVVEVVGAAAAGVSIGCHGVTVTSPLSPSPSSTNDRMRPTIKKV